MKTKVFKCIMRDDDELEIYLDEEDVMLEISMKGDITYVMLNEDGIVELVISLKDWLEERGVYV